MAKNFILPRCFLWAPLCLCVFAGSGFLIAGDGQLTTAAQLSVMGERQLLRAVYTAEIGVREATGRNDGPRVADYLRYCGLDEGYAWCAAFVCWAYGQAGFSEPRNPWSPALFPVGKIIWPYDKDRGNARPRAGDVFGIYYTSLKRIAHVGFVDGWDDTYCITVEGNTGPDGAVNGFSGVYRKLRPIRTIRAVARWVH